MESLSQEMRAIYAVLIVDSNQGVTMLKAAVPKEDSPEVVQHKFWSNVNALIEAIPDHALRERVSEAFYHGLIRPAQDTLAKAAVRPTLINSNPNIEEIQALHLVVNEQQAAMIARIDDLAARVQALKERILNK